MTLLLIQPRLRQQRGEPEVTPLIYGHLICLPEILPLTGLARELRCPLILRSWDMHRPLLCMGLVYHPAPGLISCYGRQVSSHAQGTRQCLLMEDHSSAWPPLPTTSLSVQRQPALPHSSLM